VLLPERPSKTFTLSEANALLPKVVPIVQQLQQLHRSTMDTNRRLDEAVAKLAQGNGFPVQALKQEIDDLTKRQLQLIEAFQSAHDQLEELGCVLKDINVGLVDFYGLREGELVCLCWKLGEDRIRFWHNLEDGFTGRKPLD
jgi:hypothetical protein